MTDKAFRDQNILTRRWLVPNLFFMNATAPPPDETDDSAPRAEALRDLAALRGIAMGMARALEQAVLGPVEKGVPPPAILGKNDPVLSFSRIASAVRQIVALEIMIEDGRLKPGPARVRQVSDIAGTAGKHRRQRLREAFEERVAASGITGPRAERLRIDAYQYMSDAAFIAKYDGKPMAEIIGGICAALGISPDLLDGTKSSPAPKTEPAAPGPLDCHGASAPRNDGEGAVIELSPAPSFISPSSASSPGLSPSSRGTLAPWRSREEPPATTNPDPTQDSPAWIAAMAAWHAREAAHPPAIDPRPG